MYDNVDPSSLTIPILKGILVEHNVLLPAAAQRKQYYVDEVLKLRAAQQAAATAIPPPLAASKKRASTTAPDVEPEITARTGKRAAVDMPPSKPLTLTSTENGGGWVVSHSPATNTKRKSISASTEPPLSPVSRFNSNSDLQPALSSSKSRRGTISESSTARHSSTMGDPDGDVQFYPPKAEEYVVGRKSPARSSRKTIHEIDSRAAEAPAPKSRLSRRKTSATEDEPSTAEVPVKRGSGRSSVRRQPTKKDDQSSEDSEEERSQPSNSTLVRRVGSGHGIGSSNNGSGGAHISSFQDSFTSADRSKTSPFAVPAPRTSPPPPPAVPHSYHAKQETDRAWQPNESRVDPDAHHKQSPVEAEKKKPSAPLLSSRHAMVGLAVVVAVVGAYFLIGNSVSDAQGCENGVQTVFGCRQCPRRSFCDRGKIIGCENGFELSPSGGSCVLSKFGEDLYASGIVPVLANGQTATRQLIHQKLGISHDATEEASNIVIDHKLATGDLVLGDAGKIGLWSSSIDTSYLIYFLVASVIVGIIFKYLQHRRNGDERRRLIVFGATDLAKDMLKTKAQSEENPDIDAETLRDAVLGSVASTYEKNSIWREVQVRLHQDSHIKRKTEKRLGVPKDVWIYQEEPRSRRSLTGSPTTQAFPSPTVPHQPYQTSYPSLYPSLN